MGAKLNQTFVTETEGLCLAMRGVTEPIFYLGDFFMPHKTCKYVFGN
jgi:hypothetical protein